MPTHAEMQTLQDKIVRWAADQAPIRAVLLLGSRTRRDHPADTLSDIDFVFVVDDAAPFTASPHWIHQFGAVWVYVLEDTGGGDPEYLIVYDGARKVDIVFWRVDQVRGGVDQGKREVLERGFQVLFDKDGVLTSEPPPSGRGIIPPKPDQAAYEAVNRTFWYAIYQTVRWLRRDERWMVQYSLYRARAEWLRMLMWHTRAVNDWDHDTWHAGRFLSEWASPDDQAVIPHLFAGYDLDSSWEALDTLIAHFRVISTSAAAHLGLVYPAAVDQHISGWVEDQRSTTATLGRSPT